MRALQARLAQHSVPFGHWTFLRILWRKDGLTQRELSDEAGVMEPSTFAAIKAMEALGYVRREQAPDNRKNVYVYLTASGRRLRSRLVPLAEEVNRIAVKNVPPADLASTRRTLLAIVDALSGAGASRPSRRKPARPRHSAGRRPGSSLRSPRDSNPPRRSRAA